MNILFLCTGNSCRSQMAEGWARKLGGKKFSVKSAGIEAHGKNPMAIEAMQNAGIDISDQESTRLNQEILTWADVIITVCGHADESCPTLPGTTKKIHWPLHDPAKATGTAEEIREIFKNSCREIEQLVKELIDQFNVKS